jgi:membrane protease YdiL (CAAX protease family)
LHFDQESTVGQETQSAAKAPNVSLISILPWNWAADAVCGAQLRAPTPGVCLRLLLLAPALEECVVRAGLQEWLMRRAARTGRHRAWPVLASAAAFGALHLGSGWPAALAVLAPGLALALLYQRRRSWLWCALAHGCMNAVAIAVCAG